jgi:hypothetical protein
MKHTDPHPRWKPHFGTSRHPATIEEWDSRNDPIGGALECSRRRLNVAIDYDDPRAPDQMALVCRADLSRLMNDWTHKNAVFELWRQQRADAEANLQRLNETSQG